MQVYQGRWMQNQGVLQANHTQTRTTLTTKTGTELSCTQGYVLIEIRRLQKVSMGKFFVCNVHCSCGNLLSISSNILCLLVAWNAFYRRFAELSEFMKKRYIRFILAKCSRALLGVFI